MLIGLDVYAMPGMLARRRADCGGWPKLRAATGSTRGLWPPPRAVPSAKRIPEAMFLVEGAPCAATLLACGFAAVSFPNAASLRVHEAARVACVIGERMAIVLADANIVGRAGARASAVHLRGMEVSARAIDLTPGRSDGTDVADLLRMFPDVDTASAWLASQLAWLVG